MIEDPCLYTETFKPNCVLMTRNGNRNEGIFSSSAPPSEKSKFGSRRSFITELISDAVKRRKSMPVDRSSKNKNIFSKGSVFRKSSLPDRVNTKLNERMNQMVAPKRRNSETNFHLDNYHDLDDLSLENFDSNKLGSHPLTRRRLSAPSIRKDCRYLNWNITIPISENTDANTLCAIDDTGMSNIMETKHFEKHNGKVETCIGNKNGHCRALQNITEEYQFCSIDIYRSQNIRIQKQEDDENRGQNYHKKVSRDLQELSKRQTRSPRIGRRIARKFKFTNQNNEAAIQSAIFEEDHDTLEKLLKYSSTVLHINQVSSNGGGTVLHQAIVMGDLISVQLLVQHGADIELRTSSDISPTLLAAQCGYFEIAQFLLLNGGDVGDVANGH